MAFRDLFKISRKTFFNPAGWIDADSLTAQNQVLKDLLKSTFTTRKPKTQETYEEALVRLKLTDGEAQKTGENYQFYAWIFALIGAVIFGYTFFLLFAYHTYIGCLLGFSACAFSFGQAYIYDFWALQIKRRQLGLTFAEWKNKMLGEKGTSA